MPGREILSGPLERWNASNFFDVAFGYWWPPRHARTARVLKVGASGMGANAVVKKPTVFWFFSQNVRP